MNEAEVGARSPLFRRTVGAAERALCLAVLRALPQVPDVHLVMRLGASDEAVRRGRATLASLARQIHRGWRLHLVLRRRDGDFGDLVARLRDGKTGLPALRRAILDPSGDANDVPARLLAGFAELTDRVAVVPETGSFAELAGEHGLIGTIGAGDELGCDALAELAIAAALDPAADFFYSDEARIDVASGAVAPFLKPQFSPDLLLATNYIGRLWCARLGVLDRCGASLRDWLRRGEYDLVLRLSEAASDVRHVAGVLCRRHNDRLDSAMLEEQALARALDRRGIAGEILPGCAAGIYRVRRKLVAKRLVSVVIATRGTAGLFRTCIESLRRLTAHGDIEIVAIDDIPAANPEGKAWLHAHADTVVPADGPFNWSRYNNRGAAAATGAYLLFLNDDVEIVEPGWLEAMLEHAQRPEVGCVGPRLLYPDGTVQHAGMFLAGPAHGRHEFRHLPRAAPGYFGLARTERNVTAVTGACLLTRRDVFDATGGFDEAHAVINNDLDFCLKLRERGLLCVYTPHATLIHRERASRGEAAEEYDRTAFVARWRDAVSHGDPYHHPALAYRTDDVAPDPEPVEIFCAGHPLFDRDGIRRILVVKLDHIGDCILAIPAIRRLQLHFPQAEIRVLAGPWVKPLYALVPEIAEVIELEFFRPDPALPHRRFSPEELAALAAALAPYRFDLAIDLRHYPETRPLLRHAGAALTAGFDYEGGFPWLDIALDWDGGRPGVERRRHLGDALVNLVDAVAAAGEPDRRVLPAGEAAAPRSGRKLVCVHPGAGNRMKCWPVSHFAGLIDRLVAEDDVDIVVIGADADRATAEYLLAAVQDRGRVALRVGDVALAELPGLLAGCALFVGNDSGPKHIAAGLGVPTVGVHSGTVDPREWGPMGPRAVAVWRHVDCAPCYLSRARDCPRGLACLSELRPMDVYPLCRRLLRLGRADV